MTNLPEIVDSEIKTKLADLTNYIERNAALFDDLNKASSVPQVQELMYTEILEKLPEINSKIQLFCRTDSQTTRRLLTPIMLNSATSTYRILRQILAQIESNKKAISSYISRNRALAVKISDSGEISPNVQESIKEEYLTLPYFQAAVKELHTLVEAYEEIIKNKGIDRNWDELNFELDEIRANIALGCRNAIRDTLTSGRVSGSSLELLEAFGISPFEVVADISKFVTNSISNTVDYDEYNNFIDLFTEKYAPNYTKVLKRIGLDSNFVETSIGRFLND